MINKDLKVAVLGAGAMGCLFGGLLAEKGLNVILIDVWKEHVDAINKDAYNGVDIFENVEPISSAGSPTTAPAASGPLAGQDPNDPGVNITGIMKIAAGKWNKFL